MRSRLWFYAVLLAVFMVLAWFIGPSRSWHVTHILLALAALGGVYILYNILDGFREVRQRRPGVE